MHIHFFIAPALIASGALLIGAAPALAHGSWSMGPDAQRHQASPPPTPYRQPPQQAPFPSAGMPPGPFLQVDPDPYLSPQLPPQPHIDQSQTWRERQWREQQWLESQRREREWNEREQFDWRDWGQHDRGDRFSREREGRERDWRERQGNENQSVHENRPRSDASQNGPAWGYRDNRR